MLVCSQVTQTIEQVWNETIHHWTKQAQKNCKKWPWPLSWICKVVTKLIEWIEIIVHVLIQVIVTTICHIVQAFIAIVSAIIKLIADLWWRLIGFIDFIAGLIGILPIKILRLHVVILRRRDGSLTVPEDRIDLTMQRTAQIFHDRARVKLVSTIHVLHDPAPEYALRVKSGTGFFLDLASDTGAYFQQVIETKLTGLLPAFWLRIGTPIVAFITDGVGDGPVTGCSAGPLGDYVCVEGRFMIVSTQSSPVAASPPAQPAGVTPANAASVLAHELAHACGLFHDFSDTTNLMYPNDPANGSGRGTNLSPFQRGIVRGSTHVSYF